MDKFAQTIGNIQTPSSPLGNFPALAGFYQSSFQAPLANKLTGASAANAQIDVSNQRQADSYAKQQKIQALSDRAQALKDKAEGKNYKKVIKSDGGFDFYDPLGQKINVNEYAKATNTRPLSILSDSENNLDVQYVNDHKNLNSLLKIMANNDKTALDSLFKKNPGLKEAIAGKTPEDLTKQFIQSYPHVYEQGGQGDQIRQPGVGLYGNDANKQFNLANPATYGQALPAAGNYLKTLLGG